MKNVVMHVEAIKFIASSTILNVWAGRLPRTETASAAPYQIASPPADVAHMYAFLGELELDNGKRSNNLMAFEGNADSGRM